MGRRAVTIQRCIYLRAYFRQVVWAGDVDNTITLLLSLHGKRLRLGAVALRSLLGRPCDTPQNRNATVCPRNRRRRRIERPGWRVRENNNNNLFQSETRVATDRRRRATTSRLRSSRRCRTAKKRKRRARLAAHLLSRCPVRERLFKRNKSRRKREKNKYLHTRRWWLYGTVVEGSCRHCCGETEDPTPRWGEWSVKN